MIGLLDEDGRGEDVLPREYNENIARRRKLSFPGYLTLADFGMDGDYVSPIQILSNSATGPVLLAKDWLDGPSIAENISTLKRCGYLPGMKFNNVLDRALELAKLKRADVYITQVFHLVTRERSEAIRLDALRTSFDQVTYFEIRNRPVIALGDDAEKECVRRGIAYKKACHPSGRRGTNEERSREIASAITSAMEAMATKKQGFFKSLFGPRH